MFWRVADLPLHILGSVHRLDSPAELLPHERQALDDADVVAFEADWNLPTTNERLGQYSGARSLSNDVDGSLFEQASALWSELGLNPTDLERHRPWSAAQEMMAMMLPMHGFDRPGVDLFVLGRAQAAGKSLFYLEARDAGPHAFASAPLNEQVEMLNQVVRRSEVGIAQVRVVVDAWRKRDPMLLAPVYELLIQQTPRFCRSLLGTRNKLWAPKLLRLARAGKKTVAVVGALHMHGSNSLLEQLERAGHKSALCF